MSSQPETYDAKTFADLLKVDCATNPTFNGVEIIFGNKETLAGKIIDIADDSVRIDVGRNIGPLNITQAVCQRNGNVAEYVTGEIDDDDSEDDDADEGTNATASRNKSRHDNKKPARANNGAAPANDFEDRLDTIERLLNAVLDRKKKSAPSDDDDDDHDDGARSTLQLSKRKLHSAFADSSNAKNRRRARAESDSEDASTPDIDSDEPTFPFRHPEKLTIKSDFNTFRRDVTEVLKTYEQRLKVINKQGPATRTTDVQYLSRTTLFYLEDLVATYRKFENVPRKVRECVKKTCSFIYGELMFFRSLIDPRVKGRNTASEIGVIARNEANGQGSNSEYEKHKTAAYTQTKLARQALGRAADDDSDRRSFRPFNNNHKGKPFGFRPQGKQQHQRGGGKQQNNSNPGSATEKA